MTPHEPPLPAAQSHLSPSSAADVSGSSVIVNAFDVRIWNPAGHAPHEATAGTGAQAWVMKEVLDSCQRKYCGNRRAFSIAMVPSSPIVGEPGCGGVESGSLTMVS